MKPSTSHYQHQWSAGKSADLPCGKVVCIGRNYLAHVKELNNSAPDEPLLFIKPASAITSFEPKLIFSDQFGPCHFEAEIALLIGRTLPLGNNQDALSAVAGVGLALDLTRRDLQTSLKKNGHPWEIAKGFDGSCPLTHFVPVDAAMDWQSLQLQLLVNKNLVQQGGPANMIFSIPEILAAIAAHFTLLPGDVVLTGTPAGVGALEDGMAMTLTLKSIRDQPLGQPSKANTFLAVNTTAILLECQN